MTYYLAAFGLLVLVLIVVARKNHPRLSRITIATLITLMALREMAIPLYAKFVISQSARQGNNLDAYREGALDAMNSYSSISLHLILVFLFIGAISWRVLRRTYQNNREGP